VGAEQRLFEGDEERSDRGGKVTSAEPLVSSSRAQGSRAEGEQLGSAVFTERAWLASTPAARWGALITATATALAVAALGVPVASGVAVLAMIPAMLIDLQVHRIPDPWVVVAGVSFGSALALSIALGQSVSAPNIIAGAAAMALPILCLHLISPTAMGFGDVKAAIVLGAALGVVNWQLALVGLTLAAGIGASIGTMRRSRTIAFGPYLLIGTLIALTADSVFLDAALKSGGR
jgi:leader peptidase (prepilin peptidase)/N-methyltransferase